MSGHAPAAGSTPAAPPTTGGAKGKPWGLILALALVLILAFTANWCTSSKKGNADVKKTTVVSATTGVVEVEKLPSVEVEIGKAYSGIVDIPPGVRFNFKATQPYCVINAADLEVCAERGTKDVAEHLGTVEANRELRFHSTNKPGHLTIELQRKIQ